MAIVITIEEIERIFERLIQRAKDDKIEFLEIPTDYYWIIDSDKWDDFTSDPTNPSVGSLVDDWQCLQKILKNEEHLVTYLDYDRFASILRAVSENIAPSKK